MSDLTEINVEVVLATLEKQRLLEVSVADGATAADVITVSRILDEFPNENRDGLAIGIWGRQVKSDHAVCDGDRVELYRNLELDPREARRQLALVGKTMNNAHSS